MRPPGSLPNLDRLSYMYLILRTLTKDRLQRILKTEFHWCLDPTKVREIKGLTLAKYVYSFLWNRDNYTVQTRAHAHTHAHKHAHTYHTIHTRTHAISMYVLVMDQRLLHFGPNAPQTQQQCVIFSESGMGNVGSNQYKQAKHGCVFNVFNIISSLLPSFPRGPLFF